MSYFLTFAGYDRTADRSQTEMQRLADGFCRHRWPGNVRQIQALVRRLWLVSRGNVSRMIALAVKEMDNSEYESLLVTLKATGRNRRETARRLGVSDASVRRCIAKYGLCEPARD